MLEIQQVPRDSRTNAVQRRDPMAKVKITSRTENQVIPGGYILPVGETTCLVYMPDLPILRAMVEPDPAAIKQAEAFYLKAVEQEIKDELRDIPDPVAREQRLARARTEHSGSIEGTFFFLHKRDILPLTAIDVLEENIPAPAQASTVETQSAMASIIAREVAKAMAESLPAVIAAAIQAMQASKPEASKPR